MPYWQTPSLLHPLLPLSKGSTTLLVAQAQSHAVTIHCFFSLPAHVQSVRCPCVLDLLTVSHHHPHHCVTSCLFSLLQLLSPYSVLHRDPVYTKVRSHCLVPNPPMVFSLRIRIKSLQWLLGLRQLPQLPITSPFSSSIILPPTHSALASLAFLLPPGLCTAPPSTWNALLGYLYSSLPHLLWGLVKGQHLREAFSNYPI